MILGFTGTSQEVSQRQINWMAAMLDRLKPEELHHGDCVGADAMVHALAVSRGIPVVIHPPLNPTKRAWCDTGKVTLLHPKPYIIRNHDIVNLCDELLAVPNAREVIRAGEWATIRYARRIGRKTYIYDYNLTGGRHG
jgi:hypothetical protein